MFKGMTQEDFIKLITATLAAEGIKATKSAANPVAHKALPDTLDGFERYFIDADTAELRGGDGERAVGEGELGRLGDQVHVVGAVVAECLQIEAGEISGRRAGAVTPAALG